MRDWLEERLLRFFRLHRELERDYEEVVESYRKILQEEMERSDQLREEVVNLQQAYIQAREAVLYPDQTAAEMEKHRKQLRQLLFEIKRIV